MKQIKAILASALFLAIASVAYSQSLADLAKKEKERRDEVRADAKVITNDSAAKYEGGAVTTVTFPSQPSAKAGSERGESETEAQSSGAKVDSDEPVDFQGRPESFWRKTMADARQKVKNLENEANTITLKLADLQNRFYRESNGFQQQEIQRETQKTFYEQDLNKENLAKARDELQDLEKEARKSGALPGWLTQGNR